MTFGVYEILALSAAVVAILMLGTTHLRVNLWFYAIHTLIVAVEAWWIGAFTVHYDELPLPGLFGLMNVSIIQHTIQAIFFGLFKGIGVPIFLDIIVRKIKVESDQSTFLPAPLSMHLNILLLGVSYLLAAQLPGLSADGDTRIGAMAGMSVLVTGILLMLTRKLAISQIIGFLVMENGIYLFALTQTRGMPMIIEMGILLDVLVGVMVTGLLFFNIKQSFEPIDVTQLTEFQD